MLKDVGRLISFMDVLWYVGDRLSKRSLRYTGLTAVLSLLGYLGNYAGVETYDAFVAVALPLVVGGSMLLGGLSLKIIPTLAATRAMNVVQAQDLDLMEDLRKAHEEEHLVVLWERVFRFEWAVGSAASRIREHPVEAPPEICLPLCQGADPGEQARQQFLARARFALARPQPQTRQRFHLGIDLRFFEDWRNGAYFDRQDTKLVEQFAASASIVAIKQEVSYAGWSALRDLPLKLYQKVWFTMLTRAVALHVADTVTWLNRRFQTDCFNAQAILWPGEDSQPWLEPFRLAGEDLRERRRTMLRRVFGADAARGRRVLRRMLWPGCWLASKLRAAYDPEYVQGTLGFDLVSDLEQIELPPSWIAPYRGLREQVLADGAALRAWLERFRPELLTQEHAEAMRAARIAVHVQRARLRPFLHADRQDRRAADAFVDHVLDVVDEGARARVRYSARLVGLRMHHELTRLHYREYMELLEAFRAES